MDDLFGAARHGRPAVLAILAVVLASRGAAEDPGDAEPHTIEGPARVSVSRARGVALDKLRDPACRQIFGEFRAGALSLDEVLRRRGETPEDRLRQMRFHDGSGYRLCVAPGVLAVTRIGSLDVYVCESFQTSARRNPAGAANILIHETLHSLGAGEAPVPGFPTSEKITARIALRCGR